MTASQPLDGECPPLGSNMERPEIRSMNDEHVEEFEKSVTDSLKDAQAKTRLQIEADRSHSALLRESNRKDSLQRASAGCRKIF